MNSRDIYCKNGFTEKHFIHVASPIVLYDAVPLNSSNSETTYFSIISILIEFLHCERMGTLGPICKCQRACWWASTEGRERQRGTTTIRTTWSFSWLQHLVNQRKSMKHCTYLYTSKFSMLSEFLTDRLLYMKRLASFSNRTIHTVLGQGYRTGRVPPFTSCAERRTLR